MQPPVTPGNDGELSVQSTPVLQKTKHDGATSPAALPRVRLTLDEETPPIPATNPATVTVTRRGRISKPVDRYNPSVGEGDRH